MDNNSFEQYKIAVDAAEKTTDRRNQSNTLYMAVVSIILTAIFLSFQCKVPNKAIALPQLMLTNLGFFVSLVWIGHMAYCKKMIKVKFIAVTQLENYLELLPLYKKKNDARKSISLNRCLSNNSSLEKMIPISFCFFFIIFGGWVFQDLLNLSKLSIPVPIDKIFFTMIFLIAFFIVIFLYKYEAGIDCYSKKNLNEDEILKEIIDFKDGSDS